MTSQLAIRNGTASWADAQRAALALAATAGTQFLAFTAAAQGGQGVDGPEPATNPILVPEVAVAFVAGVVVGFVVGRMTGKKKKKDE